MLIPARWKKITVDQSKVLKSQLFRFWGATRYKVWGSGKLQNGVYASLVNVFELKIEPVPVWWYIDWYSCWVCDVLSIDLMHWRHRTVKTIVLHSLVRLALFWQLLLHVILLKNLTPKRRAPFDPQVAAWRHMHKVYYNKWSHPQPVINTHHVLEDIFFLLLFSVVDINTICSILCKRPG